MAPGSAVAGVRSARLEAAPQAILVALEVWVHCVATVDRSGARELQEPRPRMVVLALRADGGPVVAAGDLPAAAGRCDCPLVVAIRVVGRPVDVPLGAAPAGGVGRHADARVGASPAAGNRAEEIRAAADRAEASAVVPAVRLAPEAVLPVVGRAAVRAGAGRVVQAARVGQSAA